MRRIGMKGCKRRKSDTSSDADSGENGGATTHNSEEVDGNSVEAEESPASTPAATPNKKRSRGRPKRESEAANAGSDGEAEDADDTVGEQENGNASKSESKSESKGETKSESKKRKKGKQKPSTSQEKPAEEDEYEVERIVGQRTIKGQRQFLVRWKGYDADSDTWEQEKDLSCPKLIEEFLEEEHDKEEEEAAEGEASSPKQRKVAKKSTGRKGKPSKAEKPNQKKEEEGENNEQEEGGSKEFEVEKIIEVHFKKNKDREFLIRWKGFTSADDTWEPEAHLNCPDLIAKFMEKVEKGKTSEIRELRTNPAHTKRYTLTTQESGRRCSRRNIGKQRTTYYQCDE